MNVFVPADILLPQLEDMGGGQMVACFCAQALKNSMDGGLF